MDTTLVRACAAVLIAAAVALFVRPQWLLEFWLGPRIFDAPKWDCLHPLLRERLREALIRRRVGSPRWPSYVCGLVLIVVASAALLAHFSVAMLYAACAIGTAPILAVALARSAPASAMRRVASLRPRRAIGPAVCISTAAVLTVAIVAFAAGSPENVLIGFAALACGASALFLAFAPAVLTGEDLAAEQYVDTMVRIVQVSSINLFGAIAALLMMTSRTTPDWAKDIAFAAYVASWFAFYFTYRIPNERERWEMVQ